MFLDLINTPDVDHTRLTSLRVAAPGAANLADAYFERIRDDLNIREFANGYALTESHAIGTRVYPWDDFETASTSSGRPGPGIELRIADANGMTQPAGKAGEIQFRGYNVMRGYFDDPDATAAAIDAQGWLHTGDIGYLDEFGRLHVNDRLKDMFIVGGFNTYPAEIEGLLSRHPAVAEVAVIGVPDERMGEVGKAFVVLRNDREVPGEDIIAFARTTMANYKVPREVVILDEMPRNASGKITKSRLREIRGDAKGAA
ncbi:AMP-binding enzyme [Phytohabitans suffuscus]|uniref:AMP-binding enzyme n=1 Tax=Phytohabitans suffuscus TaxID=624315 RepID=UPI0022B2AB69|nr:AMP-binding protein [Phytohabitans suffuscus]